MPGRLPAFCAALWAMATLLSRAADPATNLYVGPITRDATLRWLWTTQYQVRATATHGGAVTRGDEWHDAGTSILLRATAEPYYVFDGWRGEGVGYITEGTPTDTSITVAVTAPFTIEAAFDEKRTAYGTPEWWLALYGVSDLDDGDGDGAPAWQERIAGTDPTDGSSVLVFRGVFERGDDIVIRWPSVEGRSYALERTDRPVAASFVPIPGAQGLPASPPMNVYTDQTAGAEGPWFYRVSAILPE